jgi:hypothetical protein
MRKGEAVAFRLQQPNQYDDGWRPAIVLNKTNKGYTLAVLMNPQFDRDRQEAFTGILHVMHATEGEEIGNFTDILAPRGLDGEEPYEARIVLEVKGEEETPAPGDEQGS